MAAYNWHIYSQEIDDGTFAATPGQLLSYPLNVMSDGLLEYLENTTSFPDFPTSAKIMGKLSAVIPEKLTT